jgi:hypothetical protein
MSIKNSLLQSFSNYYGFYIQAEQDCYFQQVQNFLPCMEIALEYNDSNTSGYKFSEFPYYFYTPYVPLQ